MDLTAGLPGRGEDPHLEDSPQTARVARWAIPALTLGFRFEAGISLALFHKAVRWLWIVLGLWIGASRAGRAARGRPESR
jgi:hypothetical protein